MTKTVIWPPYANVFCSGIGCKALMGSWFFFLFCMILSLTWIKNIKINIHISIYHSNEAAILCPKQEARNNLQFLVILVVKKHKILFSNFSQKLARMSSISIFLLSIYAPIFNFLSLILTYFQTFCQFLYILINFRVVKIFGLRKISQYEKIFGKSFGTILF